MRRHCWFLLVSHAMQIALHTSAQAEMRTVHFVATSEDEWTQTRKVKLSAWLMKPEGTGRFPAVILLHECEPWSEKRFRQWGDLFVDWGYVAIAPDSLSPRGIKEVCPKAAIRQRKLGGSRTLRPRADPNLRVHDLLDAYRFLAQLDYVDPTKILIAGWGHGGETAMRSAFPIRWEEVAPKPVALVAFYPVCGGELAWLSKPIAPLLVLAGDKDEVVKLANCKKIMREVVSQSPKSRLVIYPGALRSFDEPGANYKKHFYRGMYHKQAHQDAIKQVRAFLSSME
jgi:dienelactone hydrolase